jgi:hypothetical protein
MKKPENTTKDVAKSLHTVTVIYQVAKLYIDHCNGAGEAVQAALDVLELAGRPDPYGLADRAEALLQLDVAKSDEARAAAADRVKSVGGKTVITGRPVNPAHRSRKQ